MPQDAFYVGADEDSDFEADEAYDLSLDGVRLRKRLFNVEASSAVPATETGPAVAVDSYTDWMGLEGGDLEAMVAVADSVSTLVWDVDDSDTKKRRRYDSSDNPNLLWRPLMSTFLDGMIRHDGLGDYSQCTKCAFCKDANINDQLFRCEDCGEFLQCEGCVRERHALAPLHVVKKWNGQFWADASLHRTTTGYDNGLGLVYQLGHHGHACPLPDSLVRTYGCSRHPWRLRPQCAILWLYQVSRPHPLRFVAQLLDNAWYPATTVTPATCATFRALELFRLLSVVGNMNAHDFVGSLERLSNPTKVGATPDRYRAFSRMARQYNMLKRLKRGGRGHEPDGVPGTGPGELAVPCWACPSPGFNLPDGWESRPVAERFQDSLMLALDANFRLKNRIRPNERADPSFGSGWSYFVGVNEYKDHLRNYVGEEDVSSCIAFAALVQKDTRLTTGLRVSGVGGCVCARHGVVRPLGLGDLQKGERYSNMDYILLSALRFASVRRLVLSYDIQRKMLPLRRTSATSISTSHFLYGMLSSTSPLAKRKTRLSYLEGVGRTDGEGIERTWSVLNPVSFATKEMGESLCRKLIVAIAECERQTQQFNEMDESLSDKSRGRWMGIVEAWSRDRTKPNPYMTEGGKKAGPSETQVLAELRKEELEEIREGRGRIAEGNMTSAGFIKAKLQLENLQIRIATEAKGKGLTADRASQLDELRVSFFKKLRVLEKLEEVFMPGVRALRESAEELRDPDLPPVKAEHVPLFLPSDLSQAELRPLQGLKRIELQLRRAQCGDAIASLRSRIHAMTHLILFRNSQVVGQKKSTRSNTAIARMNERKLKDAEKYRRAYRAMRALGGAQYAPEFKELRDEDLSDRTSVEEDDAEARARLGRVGAVRRVRTEPSLKRKTTAVSWIWFVGGSVDNGEIHDAVRVQWSKARARRDRWTEEVAILREEMKRVLRSLNSVQSEWRARAERRSVGEAGLASGLRAYALKQAAVYQRIAEDFFATWNVSPAQAVKGVMREDSTTYELLLGRTNI
ncbi:CxC2 domain-containing protein [Mycena indigotica]|uniref:CxC2 domain-containing protein n=1 Tax=Mycena indigotica TaxID=2126181 RepID=A0A8H6TFH5_9AGAR|nr:CxC2 domain-containing protein [Mycena indigotica]KAF7316401.1 CxC2 domain-containing protein [Mycena indigotica]